MQLASDKHKTFFNNIKNSIYYLQSIYNIYRKGMEH